MPWPVETLTCVRTVWALTDNPYYRMGKRTGKTCLWFLYLCWSFIIGVHAEAENIIFCVLVYWDGFGQLCFSSGRWWLLSCPSITLLSLFPPSSGEAQRLGVMWLKENERRHVDCLGHKVACLVNLKKPPSPEPSLYSTCVHTHRITVTRMWRIYSEI